MLGINSLNSSSQVTGETLTIFDMVFICVECMGPENIPITNSLCSGLKVKCIKEFLEHRKVQIANLRQCFEFGITISNMEACFSNWRLEGTMVGTCMQINPFRDYGPINENVNQSKFVIMLYIAFTAFQSIMNLF